MNGIETYGMITIMMMARVIIKMIMMAITVITILIHGSHLFSRPMHIPHSSQENNCELRKRKERKDRVKEEKRRRKEKVKDMYGMEK